MEDLGHFPGDFVVGIALGALLMLYLHPYLVPWADHVFSTLSDVWREWRRGRR